KIPIVFYPVSPLPPISKPRNDVGRGRFGELRHCERRRSVAISKPGHKGIVTECRLERFASLAFSKNLTSHIPPSLTSSIILGFWRERGGRMDVVGGQNRV
ncbi:hypothetical protein, partial [Lunatimonas salinarum]|uniref:hypothetical protein n=1 Tax=Lunatimonas salinarum TaxID=1774590 RepID=UPI001AE0BBD6